MRPRLFRSIIATSVHVIILIAGGSVLCAIPSTTAQCATTAQYLSPLPGSKNVSQQSNIIVRMGPTLNRSVAADASLFAVEGSQSGVIHGSIILSDDEKTLVFAPAHNFQPGETITVSMKNGLHAQPGEELLPVRFGFTVSPLTAAAKAVLDRKAAALYYHSYQPPAATPLRAGSGIMEKTGVFSFPPSLPLPMVKTSVQPAHGSIFFSPWKMALTASSLGSVPSDVQYLMIVDENNQPVFYKQMPEPAFDFKMLPNGTLIYFDGSTAQHIVLDNTYTAVDSFGCGNGYLTDPHDVLLLSNGHYLLVGIDPQIVDMSSVIDGGDPVATALGFVIQELDRAKNVVFEWRSTDYFQVTDATQEDLTAETIDYAHTNALEIDADSNIIISERHMDEITKIDRATGSIIWRWGGKNNQFTFINDTLGFSHQHAISRTYKGTFTLFDNGNFHVPQFSRAVEYVLDEQAKTATLVWQYRHTPDVFSAAMGSVERLPNGNTFIGWGAGNVAATEVRPDGSTAYESQFPDSVISYRAYKFQWNGVTSNQTQTAVPSVFSLAQNYPNPFNPSTVIKFSIPFQALVTLKVYDIVGNEVRTIVNDALQAGSYAMTFRAAGLASGAYFYRIMAVIQNDANSRVYSDTKKFLLLK